jgi:predicted GNAT family acetyltransferase
MMSQAITITHSESESRGRYEAHIEGKDGSGRLTYSRMSPTRIIADHTGVDDSLRGTGVARALVVRMCWHSTGAIRIGRT